MLQDILRLQLFFSLMMYQWKMYLRFWDIPVIRMTQHYAKVLDSSIMRDMVNVEKNFCKK